MPRVALGRRPSKTVEQHIAAGTFRKDRHGHLLDQVKLQVPKKPAAKTRASAKSQRRWVHNEADQRAVRNGCRFNERLAEHVVDFFAKYLHHSKGKWAGNPFELNSFQREKIIYPLFGWVRADGTRRFRRTYIEIPKKNYKSTTAAGIGLYMLVADEEAGAEVYSTGADKDQARIVHNEAINMVEASKEMASVLRINRSTGGISYDDTASTYRALSAAPAGKHGLNIHCAIIDELHEWYGRALWDALTYGYRARSQPLQFVITNAGDDLESVCWGQHEYARGVIEGKIKDESFLGLIMAAGPEDDWTDMEVIRKCNPGLGDVISETDMQIDVQRVIDTPGEQQNFKRLTVGIWATTSDPWLVLSDWAACEDEFTEADLLGCECYGGLDLAKTRDMTAFVLVFPEGKDHYLLLPFFWLPEDLTTDPKNPNRHMYTQWATDGFVTLTPGNVTDYDFVERDIVAISKRFDLRSFAFDPYNAEQLTQRLEETHGLHRVLFPQTIVKFAEPTSEFERLVVSGAIQHNGNPILSWQAGHVTIRTDANNNKRPVKPKHNDYRKIDGMVGGIMAIGEAMFHETVPDSVYKKRGIIAL